VGMNFQHSRWNKRGIQLSLRHLFLSPEISRDRERPAKGGEGRLMEDAEVGTRAFRRTSRGRYIEGFVAGLSEDGTLISACTRESKERVVANERVSAHGNTMTGGMKGMLDEKAQVGEECDQSIRLGKHSTERKSGEKSREGSFMCVCIRRYCPL